MKNLLIQSFNFIIDLVIKIEDFFNISLIPSSKKMNKLKDNNSDNHLSSLLEGNHIVVSPETESLKPFHNINKVKVYIGDQDLSTHTKELGKTAQDVLKELEYTLKSAVKTLEIKYPWLVSMDRHDIFLLCSSNIHQYLFNIVETFFTENPENVHISFLFKQDVSKIGFKIDFNEILCARDYNKNNNYHSVLCFNQNDLNTKDANIIFSKHFLVVDSPRLFQTLKENASNQFYMKKINPIVVQYNNDMFFVHRLKGKK